jgi:hypothetical protein
MARSIAAVSSPFADGGAWAAAVMKNPPRITANADENLATITLSSV